MEDYRFIEKIDNNKDDSDEEMYEEEEVDSSDSSEVVTKSQDVKESSPAAAAANKSKVFAVFRESGGGGHEAKRIRIDQSPQAIGEIPTKILQVQVHGNPPYGTTKASSNCDDDKSPGKQKIPRPANAFMIFANEWRKKLAAENPRESNKDISVRLGALWKNMSKDAKERYFTMAREVDAEHKKRYPGDKKHYKILDFK